MNKILSFFLAIIIICNSFTILAVTKIVAVVDGAPITSYQLENFKKVIKFLHTSQSLTSISDTELTTLALEALIDKIIFLNEARKHGINASIDEINQFIAMEEKAANLPDQYFKYAIKEAGVSYDDFLLFYEVRVIISKINRMLAKSSNHDIVDLLLVSTKPTEVKFLVASSISSLDNYKRMLTLQSKINCNVDTKEYSDFAEVKYVIKDLKDMNIYDRTILESLQENSSSSIIKTSNNLRFFHLCSRKVKDITQHEHDDLISKVFLNQVHMEFNKFRNKLRERAYIKVFI
ncbi:surA N-terminal domain protein [Orientia chuto str. Dubai]|uniref:SurA N-terminal domain protein n=1 Tax=Orientia chuto str. Dubai TaxID=1359168 RepID=A0A0F3MM82_9RICK|nr:SurA N-terminal domain-containing protein [Candidatus Orientia mediorientalis]KJV56771.1 surA N-terminal domain protein [Orientia chuto str. Dubai]